MKCKQTKKFIVLDLYGELEETAKPRLREHLERCAECRSEFDLTKKIFAVLD